ncbi:FtsX-like permease family protein [Mycobacterium sp. PSTR-4-N]|uniref:FtsX-like permease family protein n=1 Tax=Mycobacterium sp. PSTR-4-N TaxID=2917745 RepID=UPI001F14FF1F|nr:ABC transporter permease [Mycobacterium sp. PSTR-4-N]MCG7593982.1 ABC transporter permease [Mycobacterium sp. PSTR-4-N]
METKQVGDSSSVMRSERLPVGSHNTVMCLIRFALATIRRRPERFVLSVLGIALAIACVTVVRTVSASFAITGQDSVTDVLSGGALWVVPADGVRYDPDVEALVANGPAPDIDVPAGWTVTRTLSGVTEVSGHPVSLRGRDDVAAGEASVASGAAERLGLADGDRVTIGGQSLLVRTGGDGQSVVVATSLAKAIVGEGGWWVVSAPAGAEKRRDVAQTFGAEVGLPVTADPSVQPDPKGAGLIYDTVGGSGPLTFEQKFSALFSGEVTGSTLGLISTVGLGLGFVIAVSSFLASVTERRREFGIMSSIGLADEVLYFFLVESAIVFVTAYVLGIAAAGIAVALVIPGIATVTSWLQGIAMTAMFLPAMAIVGALVPVHRLLQQRPVELLGAR